MRVLVVEDESGIANNIAEYLRQSLFSVDIAQDGKKGWLMATHNSYDVILLDWLLPGMNGLEICDLLREQQCDAAILLLTSKDTTDDTIAGLNAGADDYMVKPFELKELLARIQALVRRQYRNRPHHSTLRVADLALNLETHEVERQGKPIKLTKKLYQLLEFLMRNKNRSISKSEIESHVWDASAQLWSDVVRSHMQKLREQVDNDFSTKLIYTVHGMGYKITDTSDEACPAH